MQLLSESIQIITQLIGIGTIVKELPNCKDIYKLSATYTDMNPNVAKLYINDNYNKILGLLSISLPQFANTLHMESIYVYLVLLVCSVALLIPKTKKFIMDKLYKKVKKRAGIQSPTVSSDVNANKSSQTIDTKPEGGMCVLG